MGCSKLQYNFKNVYRKNLSTYLKVIYNNCLDDKLTCWGKYQWDFIHDPQNFIISGLLEESEGEMINITDLLEQIRKANQQETNIIEILKDQCPQSGFKNVSIGDNRLSYLKIKCSGEMKADDFTEMIMTSGSEWELKFGDKVMIQPSEKSKTFFETLTGKAVYYQFHEIKQNPPPAKEELTDNVLFEFAVLEKEGGDFEDYLYPSPIYELKNVPWISQHDDYYKTNTCWEWQCCNKACNKILSDSKTSTSSAQKVVIAESNSDDCSNLSSNANFEEGVKIIETSLKKHNLPIMIGVHHPSYDKKKKTYYDDCSGNTPNVTNHYIIIMGMGFDKAKGQKYFRFYEVGTDYSDKAKSSENKLYINEDSKLIIGNTKYKEKEGYYTITEVRKNIGQIY